MSWFEDNKNLLLFGAELEIIGERENAGRVYLSYVKDAAKLSDREDSLEIIYGRSVYDEGIYSYSQAMNWAAVALAAKNLIIFARNKFPTSDIWYPTSKETQNEAVYGFFEWLGERRSVDINHFEKLTKVKRELEENNYISLNISSSVARYGFMDVVSEVVSGNIRVFNKGLVR